MLPAQRARASLLLVALMALAAEPEKVSVAGKVAWLKDHIVSLRSIDTPDNDYSDLRPLQESIGPSRIVLLGGSGDVSVSKAKTRLVRFLHEELGFSVLATAANPVDAAELDDVLDRRGRPSLALRRANIYLQPDSRMPSPILAPEEVLRYVETTHRGGQPLHLAGSGSVGGFNSPELLKRLFRFADRVAPHLLLPEDRKVIAAMVALTTPMVQHFPGAYRRMPGSTDWHRRLPPGLAVLTKLYEGFGALPANGPDAHEAAVYRQAILMTAWFARLRAGIPVDAIHDSVVETSREWEPTRKIIVWCDNRAAARNLGPLGRSRLLASLRPWNAGDDMTREFGDAVYSIGFTETRTTGELLELLVAGPQPSLAPADGNLESLLHATGEPYAFLDLRSLPQDHWLRLPLTARFLGAADVFAWPTKYDAVLSIDLTLAKPRKQTHPAATLLKPAR